MIKIVVDIRDVNYDEFIDRAFDMIKEHPEQLGGHKLPPFSKAMIKKLPKHQKNEMIVQSFRQNKAQYLPQFEQAISRFAGPVRLRDADVSYNKKAPCPFGLMIEVMQMDEQWIIENLMPRLYRPEESARILGAGYSGPTDLASVQNYMRGLDYKSCELVIARTLSASKAEIAGWTSMAGENAGIHMQIETMHVLVK